jgi:pimeloyl-ACP methyl ester carboxylesterase
VPDADLGDVTIHYEEAGDGPLTYVYCHGLGSNSAMFVDEDMAWYAERFRTIAWDQRGLGQSGHAAKYSLPLYAADLAGLLDHLRVERAVIFGVSWGGYLVQRFALDFPERCAALVIDSSSSEVNVASSQDWYQRSPASARRPSRASASRRRSRVIAPSTRRACPRSRRSTSTRSSRRRAPSPAPASTR